MTDITNKDRLIGLLKSSGMLYTNISGVVMAAKKEVFIISLSGRVHLSGLSEFHSKLSKMMGIDLLDCFLCSENLNSSTITVVLDIS